MRLFLLLVLTVSLAACGGGSSSPSPATPAPIPVQTPPGAQTLGSISQVRTLPSCPSGFAPGSQCTSVVVSCPSTTDIQAIYGVQQVSGAKGTVVLLSGTFGTSPFQGPALSNYPAAGYSVVNLQWASPWEDTGMPQKSIGNAACRPATIMSYLLNTVFTNGAKCALGFSGGSGALGYALAWYGADTYLDKVQLESGPVFSDIEQGCMVPNPPPVTVCPPGQFGCQPGDTFSAPLTYPSNDADIIRQVTADNTCGGASTTSSTSNTDWKSMSILDGTTKRNFIYPKTSISGWECDNGLNNSASEANLWFQQFTNSSQAASLLIVPVSSCTGAEGVDTGFTPTGLDVPTAMLSDFTDPVNGCVAH